MVGFEHLHQKQQNDFVQMDLNLQSTEVEIGVWVVEMLRIIKEYLPYPSTYNGIGGRKLSHACFGNIGSSFSFYK